MIKLQSLLTETTNTKIEKIGYDPEEVSSGMPINWDEEDIQMLAKWDVKTVREFAAKPNSFVAIYPSIMDVNDLDPRFAEEEEEFSDSGYEWDEFRRKKNGFPPIVIRRNEYGHILMMDGNHRVKWAQDVGYKTIGAWVVDEFLQKIIDSRKKK